MFSAAVASGRCFAAARGERGGVLSPRAGRLFCLVIYLFNIPYAFVVIYLRLSSTSLGLGKQQCTLSVIKMVMYLCL